MPRITEERRDARREQIIDAARACVREHGLEAILDTAEELLQTQGYANISGVAVQAGVSRVTVYAHFPTWETLLKAAVERAVRRTIAALQSVHPDDGPPVEALDRMLAAA